MPSSTERKMPANAEAERFILGNVLLENATLVQAVRLLQPESFYHDAHRRTYRAMLHLWEQERPIDVITLPEALRQAGDLELVGGTAFLGTLMDGVPRFSNIEEYCRIVAGKARVRQVIMGCQNVIAQAYEQSDDPEAAIRALVALTDSLLETQELRTTSMAQAAEEAERRLVERWKREDGVIGIRSGISALDMVIGGFEGGETICIAGTPGAGKSVTASEIALHATTADGERPVILFISAEMKARQIVTRQFAATAQLDAWDIKHAPARLNDQQIDHLMTAIDKLKPHTVEFFDSGEITPGNIRVLAQAVKRKYGRLDLILTDYLQILDSDKNAENENVRISDISRKLKQIAMLFDVPVINLAQLNRDQRKQNRAPELHDLRGSGSIEQDHSVVTFLWLPNPEQPDQVQFLTRKNRDGQVTAEETAPFMRFVRSQQRFEASDATYAPPRQDGADYWRG